MPNLFVVTDEADLAGLARSVLKPRTTPAVREVAIDAIRRANPALDLERLRPGMVVVIPPVPGTRPAADDPAGKAVGDLVARIQDGMEALVRGAEAGLAARDAERRESRDLFESAIVQQLAANTPEIARNIESVEAAFEEDDTGAKRAMGDLREALDGWAADLDGLRGLLPR